MISLNDQSVLEKLEISEEKRKLLIDCISKRMKPPQMKVRADFEICFYNEGGIENIKKALTEAKAETDELAAKYKSEI